MSNRTNISVLVILGGKALTNKIKGTVPLVLWVVSSQIGNRGTIYLFFLLILFKLIVEGVSGFLSYTYVKFITPTIIAAIFFLPQYAYR